MLNELDRVTRELRVTKNEFLERAIRAQAKQLLDQTEGGVWAATLGAWNRSGSPDGSVRRARGASSARWHATGDGECGPTSTVTF